METKKPPITIGYLKDQLSIYPDDYTLDFGGLDFNRLKQRAPTHVNMEFHQRVYLDEEDRVVVENLE